MKKYFIRKADLIEGTFQYYSKKDTFESSPLNVKLFFKSDAVALLQTLLLIEERKFKGRNCDWGEFLKYEICTTEILVKLPRKKRKYIQAELFHD